MLEQRPPYFNLLMLGDFFFNAIIYGSILNPHFLGYQGAVTKKGSGENEIQM